MVQLILYVAVAAVVGMASGALGGAIIGAIASYAAVARGIEIGTAIAIGVGDGMSVGGPVGAICGGVVGGATWAGRHNLLKVVRAALLPSSVSGAITSLGTVLGSATWPILGICVATIVATIFGLSRLNVMRCLAIRSGNSRSRGRPAVRTAEQIPKLIRLKRRVRDATLTIALGISIGAAGGGSFGALLAVLSVIAVGFPVGDFAIGGLAGASIGAIVGTIATATARFAGHTRGIKRVALAHGSAFGAAASLTAVFGKHADPAFGAMIGTIIGFLYGSFGLTSTITGGKLSRRSHL